MKEEKLSTMQQQQQQQNDQRDKNDYYSLPLASITFGHNDQRLMQMQMSSKESNESSIRRITYIEEQQNPMPIDSKHNNNNNNNNDYIKDNTVYSNNKSSKQTFNPNQTSSFINKFGCHNSFLGVIIHSIYNMKQFRDFIINEYSDTKEKDTKTKLLFHLRLILLKYAENKKIDLSQLRSSLAELFQNRRKFLLDHPDDPIDCYFAIVNAVHSSYMQYPLNEITDESCRDKCFAHRELWLDLARIDECECKGSTKRLFSNHNYVFDIPLDAIFDLVKTISISHSESNYRNIKVKERHISQIPYSMTDLQGKLFLYYKYLLNQIKAECPVNGTRCNINKNHKHLVLSNNPAYYVFALQRNSVFQFSISDILRVFMLIGKVFEVGTLFEQVPNRHNGNGTSANVFDFLGCVLIRASKVYSCVFKSQLGNRSTVVWVYYDDETVITLPTWFDLVSYCIKNGDMPIMLFYTAGSGSGDSNAVNTNCDISQSDTVALERYAINADNLSKYYMNRIRILEDVINTQDVNSSNIKGSQVSSTNDSNEHGSVKGGDVNPFMRGGLNANNNSSPNAILQNIGQGKKGNSGIINGTVINYYCQNCHYKNKIENRICLNCGKCNNIDLSYEGEEKQQQQQQQQQHPFNSNNKPNINTNSVSSVMKHKDKSTGPNPNMNQNPNSNINNYIMSNKPSMRPNNVRHNLLLNSNEKNANINNSNSNSNNPQINPFKNEVKRPVTEQEKDIRAKKYYDMPRQIPQKRETPVMIKNTNIPSSPQNNLSSETEPTRQVIKYNTLYLPPQFNSRTTEGKGQNSAESRRQPSNKKPSNKEGNMNLNQTEVWSCSNCNTLNKEHEYKCKYCKSIKKTENSYSRIHTPKAQHSSSGRHSLNKNSGSNSTKKLEKKKSTGQLEPHGNINNNTNPNDKKYHNFNTISHHNDIERSTNSLRPSQAAMKNQNGICYPSSSKVDRPKTSLLEYPQRKGYQ